MRNAGLQACKRRELDCTVESADVGQAGSLRPADSRPVDLETISRKDTGLRPGGGCQPPRRLPACPTSALSSRLVACRAMGTGQEACVTRCGPAEAGPTRLHAIISFTICPRTSVN